MEQPLHPGRHIIMYAKGRYEKRGDLIQDMRVLVGEYTGTDPIDVDEDHIFDVVWDITAPFILDDRNGDPKFRVWMLLRVLLNHSLVSKKPLTVADVVVRLLATLRLARVRDGDEVLLSLGDPDGNLLPLAEE